ncbi:MAG: glycosyl hydrolase, partial [Flavobacteriaceae bacterium]|nr:glycosyl hydrolase [Flavobacteriaceae bacterium]
MALTVSPTNANIVFVGVLDIWRSIDGGSNFVQKNHWWNPSEASYTHADIHFLRYFNNKLYAGTDGGIYESSNDAGSFTDLTENLNISQYYKISTAKGSASNIAGGLQDNGGFAFSNNQWHKYHGGDGMDCAVDPNNQNIYYGFTQYGGSLNITYNAGVSDGGTITSAPNAETGTGDSGGNWITPLVANNKGVLYAGYSKLYKLENNSWQAVSSNVFGGDLNNIAIAPSDNEIFFVSKSNNLYQSSDGGVTFSQNVFNFSSFISSIDIN